MASIFTRILNQELPGHFVWKDAVCFAIMTIQPIRRGHLIVIPNQEVNHWDDVPAGTARHLMDVSQHIARAIKAVVPCRRVGLSIIGLEVPHTHIHLMPIDSMQDMDFSNARDASAEQLAQSAAEIRSVLQEQGFAEASVD